MAPVSTCPYGYRPRSYYASDPHASSLVIRVGTGAHLAAAPAGGRWAGLRSRAVTGTRIPLRARLAVSQPSFPTAFDWRYFAVNRTGCATRSGWLVALLAAFGGGLASRRAPGLVSWALGGACWATGSGSGPTESTVHWPSNRAGHGGVPRSAPGRRLIWPARRLGPLSPSAWPPPPGGGSRTPSIHPRLVSGPRADTGPPGPEAFAIPGPAHPRQRRDPPGGAVARRGPCARRVGLARLLRGAARPRLDSRVWPRNHQLVKVMPA